MDTKKITNISIGGIDMTDYPDFCDAFIESAHYDGVPITEKQLDEINKDTDYVYDAVQNYLF